MNKLIAISILGCFSISSFAYGQAKAQSKEVQISAPETLIQAQPYVDDRFDLPDNASPELKKLKDKLDATSASFISTQKDLATTIERSSKASREDLRKLNELIQKYDQQTTEIEDIEGEFVGEKDLFQDDKADKKLADPQPSK